MIYDVFLFHGELDLLEIRLNILDKVADKFVICEAKQNFSGTPYESLYLANKERFKRWEDKIIHFRFNLMEDAEIVTQARESGNTNFGDPYWMKVYYAMEMLKKPLADCKEEDIIFISDCDEIWNPELELQIRDNNINIWGFKQFVYYYYLNNRCNEDWIGTIALSYKRLKGESINNIKQKGEIEVENGGWHFTYQGGEEEVKRKVESSRDGTNQDSYYGVTTDFILERRRHNKDIFPDNFRPKRKFWTDEGNWPKYLAEHRQKYEKMLK